MVTSTRINTYRKEVDDQRHNNKLSFIAQFSSHEPLFEIKTTMFIASKIASSNPLEMKVNQVVVTLQHPANAKQFLTFLVLTKTYFVFFSLFIFYQ